MDAGAGSFPRVIEAGASARDAVPWVRDARAQIEAALAQAGAVLLRGFAGLRRDGFEEVCRALTPSLRSYVGGGSPRTHLGGRVYTSTEYPARAGIPLHCEASYLPDMPARIWFYCELASEDGGETPIGDMTGMERRLDPEFVDRLRRAEVLYVSNLHGGVGFGKSWMQTYETEDRDEVEAHLASQGAAFEWTKSGLRVELRAPAMRRHSRSGEDIWVNQMVNWHPAHLGEAAYQNLRRIYGEERNFPKCAFYGDGTPIEAEHVVQVSDALSQIETVFAWRSGDILLIDNERVAHGRRPFRGERSMLVAMA